MALSEQQIAQLWVNQGGDPSYATVMARIAKRESGGRPGINNRGLNKNGTVDWGLYQVNDVWRKDPVVGPLFRSGQILTAQGATKAAIHILKVQGPKAWATYNPATDQKYLGAFSGSKSPVTRAVAGAASGTPGVDNSALRAQAVQQLLGSKNSDPVSFAMAFRAAQDVPGQATAATAPSRPTSPTAPAGGGNFRKSHSPLLELFWQGQGGIDAKNGQAVPQGFVSGHQDHVHVAAGPKTVVELGQLAQQMGLHVGENPHFGGVNPVHVKNSFHYKGEAIDVSGDPAKMQAFAHRVARLYGIRPR